MAGRNDPCPCGSGRKFKRCHGTETKRQEMRTSIREFHATVNNFMDGVHDQLIDEHGSPLRSAWRFVLLRLLLPLVGAFAFLALIHLLGWV